MNPPNCFLGHPSQCLSRHEKACQANKGIHDNGDATFKALIHSLVYKPLPPHFPRIADDALASNNDDNNDDNNDSNNNNTDNSNAHDNKTVSVIEFEPFTTETTELKHDTNNETHHGTTEAPDRPPTMINVGASTEGTNNDVCVDRSRISDAIHNPKSTQHGFPESYWDDPTCIDASQVISPRTLIRDSDTSRDDDTRGINNSSLSGNSTMHSLGEQSGQGEEDSGALSTDDLELLVSVLTEEWITKDDPMHKRSAKSDVVSHLSGGNNTRHTGNGVHDPPSPLIIEGYSPTPRRARNKIGSTNTQPESPTGVQCRAAYVTDRNDSDVICGRATNETQSNPGNQLFRELVESFRSDYVATSKTAKKRRIADEVKARIASEGGRFLHKIVVLEDGTTKPYTRSTGQAHGHVQYVQASEKTIHEKVTKELRRKPDKRCFNGTG